MKMIKKTILMMTVVAMITSLSACGKTDSSSNTTDQSTSNQQEQAANTEAFPKFTAKDFDGNVVDDSLFANNEATLLNFWFNGCSACVNEMPGLEKLNAKLRERGAELIGVNVQAGESQKTLDEAKDILSKQGATYRNIVIDDDSSDARAYISKIFSFPTTIIVDKNGNIIGKPILGNIDDETKMEEILKVIDDLKSGKDTSSSITSEENPEMDKVAALFAKENEVFAKHQNLWDKVFAKIQKDKIPSEEQTSYPEFLKSQVEKTKESFTEEELQILNDDIKEIEKIETEIQELNKTNQN